MNGTWTVVPKDAKKKVCFCFLNFFSKKENKHIFMRNDILINDKPCYVDQPYMTISSTINEVL